uniref:Ubiquitin-like protease family profile domain-containing protein n=1 Tax=Oryza nivara TaxID=4536 RepID=A0A0E0HEJ6_ORYNI
MGKRRREELNVQAKPSDDKGPPTRCNPGCVRSLAKLLPTAVEQKIQELGLRNLFKLKLEALSCRKICGDLLDKAVVHAASDLIELPMGDVSLWILEKVVQHAIDMPVGSVKGLSKSNNATEYKRMYNALRFVCKKFPLPKGKARTAAGGAQDSEAVGGAQGSTIAGDQADARGAQDSTAAGDAQDSTTAAGDAHDSEEDFGDYDSTPADKRRNIFVPDRIVNLVIHCEDEEVVILDCIEGNDLQVNEAGRMYLYNDDKVKGLLKENPNDMIKKWRGRMTSKPLEAFIFKKWEDTCYAKFVEVPERIEVPKSTEMPKRIEVLERTEVIEIFIPIVNEGHWSLVVVTIKPEHVYILYSEPLRHQSEAAAVIDRLTEHLSSKHVIDIFGYPKDTPNVKPQDNNWDCGFHVLLYIKGFENRDIFDINEEAVFKFRMKLSVELRHHKMNRARAVGPIHIRPKEGKGASRDAYIYMEESIAASAEDNQEEAEVKGKDASGKPAGEDDDNALISPQDKRTRRKTTPSSSFHEPPKFEVATQLTATKTAEVYDYTGDGMQGIGTEIASWLMGGKKDVASGKKLRNIRQRFVIVPIFQHEEWTVFFVDTCSSDQVSVLISTTTKLGASEIEKSARTFAEQAHDGFMHGGYASPFPVLDQIRAATVFIKSRPCTLATMVYLERYNGYEASFPPASFTVEEHVQPKLVYFLLHKKNEVQLPPEITSIVKKDEKKKKKK